MVHVKKIVVGVKEIKKLLKNYLMKIEWKKLEYKKLKMQKRINLG